MGKLIRDWWIGALLFLHVVLIALVLAGLRVVEPADVTTRLVATQAASPYEWCEFQGYEREPLRPNIPGRPWGKKTIYDITT